MDFVSITEKQTNIIVNTNIKPKKGFSNINNSNAVSTDKTNF